MTDRVVFEKTYHGYEDAADLERDISEMWYDKEAFKDIPGDFQGKLKVVVTYVPEE